MGCDLFWKVLTYLQPFWGRNWDVFLLRNRCRTVARVRRLNCDFQPAVRGLLECLIHEVSLWRSVCWLCWVTRCFWSEVHLWFFAWIWMCVLLKMLFFKNPCFLCSNLFIWLTLPANQAKDTFFVPILLILRRLVSDFEGKSEHFLTLWLSPFVTVVSNPSFNHFLVALFVIRSSTLKTS